MRAKDKVRYGKVALLIITILIFVAYLVNKWSLSNKFDDSLPEITFDQEVLQVPVEATQEDLLQGVTAYDAKDGDVTDSIMIESMSNLLEDNQRIVTYVAFDGDKHVGRAERRIQYTNYTPPRFVMKESMKSISLTGSWEQNLGSLRAIDCIDGDITDDILMVDYSIAGISEENATLTYELQVTNSCGDTVNLSLPLQVWMNGILQKNMNAEIALSEYLVYVERGKRVDLTSFITTAMVNGEAYDVESVKITSDLNIWSAGTYTIVYAIDEEEAQAVCSLIIVVEE